MQYRCILDQNLCLNKLSRVGVGVAGSVKNKAISASNEVEVEVEAELGNLLWIWHISYKNVQETWDIHPAP